MVWAPFMSVVVSSVKLYGAVASGAPTAFPSARSVTPVTPTLSIAVADTVTEPVSVAPETGEVTVVVGAVVSVVDVLPGPVTLALSTVSEPFPAMR